jgi:TRAP-type mannitol/chloroaromatic compound transport system substrate-binding protein
MVTTWPPKFPIFQTGAEDFAKRVKEMSGGRMSIKVYAGGELVPPMGVFDAVSSGTTEIGSSGSYYWAGKIPAAQFFTAVPFGFTGSQMNAWLYHGGGQELWDEIYAPFNLKAFPSANTGVQMGGWFNKKIESMADLKGLKMRIPGLGGKVMNRAGANVVLLPASELYTALERGVIDALEWAGPYHDLKLGFYRAAKYYYYPGWHEPGSVIETIVNRQAYEKLPPDLKAIVASALAESNIKSRAEFDAKNGSALDELTGKYKVELKKFPDDVLKNLHTLSEQTLKELAESDPKSKKVYDGFTAFSKKIVPWTALSEGAFMAAKSL